VLHDAGKGGQRVFGDVAILLAAAERFKAQQRRSRGGIAGRGGRILERLAARTQHAQRHDCPSSGGALS
jgi:hypothetical protein